VITPMFAYSGEGAMAFRREWGSLVWHWRQDCSFWPKKGLYDEQPKKGTLGNLCGECCEKSGITTPPALVQVSNFLESESGGA
jgi:hypothetical protein